MKKNQRKTSQLFLIDKNTNPAKNNLEAKYYKVQVLIKNYKNIEKMMKRFFQNYESQQDEDYNPTARQQAIYKLQHQRKKKVGTRSSAVDELWLQLQSQHQKGLKKIKPNQDHQQNPESPQQPSPLQLAQKILNNSSIKPDKRIIFAGKEYIMNEQTGQLEIAQKIKPLSMAVDDNQVQKQDNELAEHKKTRIAYHYLNHVMRAIYNRSRKINAVGKSKLDWKGFVKQEGIEHKLSYHRKGGVIKDMQFLKNAS